VISVLVLIILVIWTILDPPRLKAEYEMTDMLSENRETVVNVRYFCGSDSDVWYLMTIGWSMVLLLCASVLAFQTRNVRQDFSESRTLATMIYSHVVLVALRARTFLLLSSVSEWTLAHVRSLIFSFDTCATLFISFVPKLSARDDTTSSSEFNGGSQCFAGRQMFQWISRLPSALSHEPSEGDDETDHAVVDTESATTKEADDQEQPKANLTTGQRKKTPTKRMQY